MKRWMLFLWLGWAWPVVQAGVVPAGCDDLSGVPVTPNVDFASQIQPIFDNNGCVVCHGGNGNLYLNAGVSYGNLVNVPADAPVPVNRVLPGSAGQSFLFWKVNCDDPVSGARMPIGGTLSAAEQALIRDWINQGAAASAAGAATPVPGPAGGWLVVLVIGVLLLGLRLSGRRVFR